MPRHSLKSLARSLVASESALETVDPSEPEKLDHGDETAGLSAAPVEVEGAERRSAASATSRSITHPVEGEQALEGPDWQKEFESPEALYARFKDVDFLRGRQANEVGLLRRQVGLYERTIHLLAATRDPAELAVLLHAAGLIHEPKAHESIEEILDVGEQAYEETAHAV